MTPSSRVTAKTKPDLVLTRTFDAPRALVWAAWTQAEHLSQWWGPDHFKVTRCEWQVRQGGPFRIEIQAPDGGVWAMTGAFLEVKPLERLSISGIPQDPSGAKLFEASTTVTFSGEGGKTRVQVDVFVATATPIADEHLEGMREGWDEQLTHLANLLPRLH